MYRCYITITPHAEIDIYILYCNESITKYLLMEMMLWSRVVLEKK